ncbi:outer membrane beta-barrel family protein [Rhizosphaericola mali]|uniref:TonB-dependent receptor n=1 Tax=Rhizosphaericola mali TaxID=2545455 RepID=A0A5P2G0H4_9BACT|nr:outer membrane beta-barrel family protein [Rhizosphaericola mali]QES87629.1 TonB-dependent receptor [Rhizosphaericola mali]
MNSFKLILIFVGLALLGKGQSLKVIVSSNEHTISGIDLQLFNGNKIIGSSTTDSFGICIFSGLKPLDYKIKVVSSLYVMDSFFIRLNIDTSIEIHLKLNNHKLQEVVVNSQKPSIQRKIDRLIFNIADNVNYIGDNLLSVLSKLPKINVDENSIAIIGKGDVSIMINDKIVPIPNGNSLIAFLKSIPASRIDHIEVMTNPPSIYSAEGNGGIINIILKKNKDKGITGSIQSTFFKGKYINIVPSVNLNYNTSKYKYFLNVTPGIGAQENVIISNLRNQISNRVTNERNKTLSNFLMVSGGMETEIDKINTISASMNYMVSYPKQSSSIQSIFTNQENIIDSLSKQTNISKTWVETISGNLHYTLSFDSISRRKLTIDADLSQNKARIPVFIDNEIYNGLVSQNIISKKGKYSNSTPNTVLFSLNTLIHYPIKKIDFSFGLRFSFVSSEINTELNTNSIMSLNPPFNNYFHYNENTQAFFANMSTDITRKLSLQTGVRLENTFTTSIPNHREDSSYSYNYLNAFPTIYLLYKAGDHYLNINYGRRISRPNMSSFNPNLRYIDDYTYIQGNQYLKPTISNSIEISDTYKNNLIFSTTYSFSNHGIGSIPIIESDSKTVINRQFNYLSVRSLNIELLYILKTFKWLQSSSSLVYYYNKTYSDLDFTNSDITGWGGAFTINSSFFFNKIKTIKSGVYFKYNFSSVNQIYRIPHYYFIDWSGQYTFPNKKTSLGIRVSDIFKSRRIMNSYILNNISYDRLSFSDTRRIYLTFQYNFGNLRLKGAKAYKGVEDSRIGN